jgi:hypothetical protein
MSSQDISSSAPVATSIIPEPSGLKENFNIFLMKKDGTLINQAQVEQTRIAVKPYSQSVVKLNQLPMHIMHMSNYFQELYELMMKYEVDYPFNSEIYKTKKYEFGLTSNGTREFVSGMIFHRVLMRKGSYFYVLQKSDRGVRFLLYAMNITHHSSCAFGWSMIMPKPAEELKDMREKLEKFTIKQVQDLEITNFSELIKRDDLYFL